ncbi:GbsR/MarR family transcriptional regulator [Virgibacillus ainsalahensis]
MFYPNNEETVNKIIIEFSKTIEMFDLSPVEARLFAYLYLTNEPLTLDEMSEAVGKSKTSMSTSIRTLSDINLVTRVWKKGVRKDLYQANTQLFKSFMNSYISKWVEAANHQKDSLDTIKVQIETDNRNGSSEEFDLIDMKLNNIIEFHTQVGELFRKMKQE